MALIAVLEDPYSLGLLRRSQAGLGSQYCWPWCDIYNPSKKMPWIIPGSDAIYKQETISLVRPRGHVVIAQNCLTRQRVNIRSCDELRT